ncbi:CASP-like protein 2C1 [Nymphaea colorata]|nr:CASP-like protein 2C1 [Nymphaea colorata]
MEYSRLVKAEAALRFLAIVLTMATAVLIGTTKETEMVFGVIKETANVHSLQALVVLLVTHSIATGYLLAQLCKACLLARSKTSLKSRPSKGLAWISFSMDQVMAYATFSVTTAATQGCYFAVSGQTQFQWMKLCNIYTRFCDKVAAALLFGLAASFLLAVVSCISAYNVFRLYPCKRPIAVKG